MENTKIETQVTQPTTSSNPQVASIDADKLLKALYWIWDAFERTNMPYFLDGITADQVIKQKDLIGDAIYIGVKDTEWRSGGKRILDAFITPLKESENNAEYAFEDVPIYLTVYKTSPCIEQLNMIRYRHEEFFLPNPYDTFLKTYYG